MKPISKIPLAKNGNNSPNYSATVLTVALVLVAAGGLLLLQRADRQARDTTRKHHLEDIEQALYFAESLHGTYPPYDQPTWCGIINAKRNRTTRDQIETALRAQHEKYENPEKPFPSDPKFADSDRDYFYWKRSPSTFELYAVLEDAPSGERNTRNCTNAPNTEYDYGIASIWREGGPGKTYIEPIL